MVRLQNDDRRLGRSRQDAGDGLLDARGNECRLAPVSEAEVRRVAEAAADSVSARVGVSAEPPGDILAVFPEHKRRMRAKDVSEREGGCGVFRDVRKMIEHKVGALSRAHCRVQSLRAWPQHAQRGRVDYHSLESAR